MVSVGEGALIKCDSGREGLFHSLFHLSFVCSQRTMAAGRVLIAQCIAAIASGDDTAYIVGEPFFWSGFLLSFELTRFRVRVLARNLDPLDDVMKKALLERQIAEAHDDSNGKKVNEAEIRRKFAAAIPPSSSTNSAMRLENAVDSVPLRQSEKCRVIMFWARYVGYFFARTDIDVTMPEFFVVELLAQLELAPRELTRALDSVMSMLKEWPFGPGMPTVDVRVGKRPFNEVVVPPGVPDTAGSRVFDTAPPPSKRQRKEVVPNPDIAILPIAVDEDEDDDEEEEGESSGDGDEEGDEEDDDDDEEDE